jgi:hypothetical protein
MSAHHSSDRGPPVGRTRVRQVILEEEAGVPRGRAPTRRQDETDDRFDERRERWQARLDQIGDTADVIVSKQRHAPIVKATLRCVAGTTIFQNLVAPGRPPAAG